MNSNEKELLNAINGTERMSGFDSYDNYEGDMSYFEDFDGDDFNSFDGDDFSYAAGPGGQPVSDPYVIQYANTTTVTSSAILFGFNDYFAVTSGTFGTSSNISVTTLQGGTYTRLISQTQNKPLRVGKWRFQASSATSSNVSSQLAITITINQVDANGKVYSVPLNLAIMRDAYQFQSDILDVTRPVTVDGNTYLSFNVLGSTTFTISVFPIDIISAKARLNGGNSINKARAPRLSGKNVAPVIIQTTQGVKGVTKA